MYDLQVCHIYRRLSKDNVKQFGRHIGKVSHANPVVVFDTIVSQIQAYDNLIQPVTDAFKYLTQLSYDALSCTYIDIAVKPNLLYCYMYTKYITYIYTKLCWYKTWPPTNTSSSPTARMSHIGCRGWRRSVARFIRSIRQPNYRGCFVIW